LLVSQYPDKALRLAVLMTNEFDDSQRLPIHLACDTNAPIDIIQWLLQQDTQKTSILQRDKWGDLPIHTACSRKYTQLVQLLLEQDASKSSLLTKDKQGASPLHMACRYVLLVLHFIVLLYILYIVLYNIVLNIIISGCLFLFLFVFVQVQCPRGNSSNAVASR
jgi:ankyrin repeat protein